MAVTSIPVTRWYVPFKPAAAFRAFWSGNDAVNVFYNMFWVATLLLTAIGLFRFKKMRHPELLMLLYATMGGFFAYQELFEYGPRYLNTFLPVFALAAAFTIDSLRRSQVEVTSS
jgi:hypothetical protein